jgi:hypothetical protein
MLYYEVKLINPETKEVFFSATSLRPEFPSQDLMDRHQGAILVIRTTPNPLSG